MACRSDESINGQSNWDGRQGHNHQTFLLVPTKMIHAAARNTFSGNQWAWPVTPPTRVETKWRTVTTRQRNWMRESSAQRNPLSMARGVVTTLNVLQSMWTETHRWPIRTFCPEKRLNQLLMNEIIERWNKLNVGCWLLSSLMWTQRGDEYIVDENQT